MIIIRTKMFSKLGDEDYQEYAREKKSIKRAKAAGATGAFMGATLGSVVGSAIGSAENARRIRRILHI